MARAVRQSWWRWWRCVLIVAALTVTGASTAVGGGGRGDGKEWRRIGLFFLAHATFSALDALIYPKLGENKLPYRIGQHAFLAGQVVALKELDNWNSAVGYLFSHWSFNNDHFYYFWYWLFYGENNWKNEVWNNQVTWGRWTWMGLADAYFSSKPKWNEPMSGLSLVVGGTIGIGVGISLIIFQPIQ